MGRDLEDLHHANLLVGESAEAEIYLRSLCSERSWVLANSPDFFAFRMEVFGIDEARELRLVAARKAFGERKIFLITSARLTLEAQNALLKTFEDPFPETYFFLVVREEAQLLGTLRSRMQTLRVPKGLTSASIDAEQFLKLALKDRLSFAKEFASGEKNISTFLDSILLVLRKREKSQALLESVYNFSRTSDNTRASSRLIIEHLSLVLPRA